MSARTKAMDWAAFWFVLAALVVATAAAAQLYFLVAVAWFPARWAVAHIVVAVEAGRATPPPADKPFGYEPTAADLSVTCVRFGDMCATHHQHWSRCPGSRDAS